MSFLFLKDTDTGWNERQECRFGSTRLTPSNKFTDIFGPCSREKDARRLQYLFQHDTDTQRQDSAVYSLDVSIGMYREAWHTPVVALVSEVGQ